VIRLLTVPLRLLALSFRRLVTFPFRLAALSARTGWRSGRLVGLSRSGWFGVGFTTGVLVVSPKARRAAFTGVTKLTVAAVKARKGTEPPEEGTVTVPGDGAHLPTD
jgi:hypothetical protein